MRAPLSLSTLCLLVACSRDAWQFQPRDAATTADGRADVYASDAPLSSDTNVLNDVPRVPGTTLQVLTARGVTFALRADGAVFAAGQGVGSFEGIEPSSRGEFVRVPGLEGAQELSLASLSPMVLCARLSGGAVRCRQGSVDPVVVRDLDDAQQVSGRCAMRSGGGVACWGLHDYRAVAVPISDALRVSSWGDLHCALRRGGAVACWGAVGAVMDPTPSSRQTETPEAVPGVSTAVALAVGPRSACAALSLGSVVCWGRRSAISLGDEQNVGATAVPGASEVRALSSNAGLRADGRVLVWGSGSLGTRGDGTFRGSVGAALVPGVTARRLAEGDSLAHVCAALDEGGVACWGDDEHGQLARGGGIQRWPLPALANPEGEGGAPLTEVTDVMHSATAICALRDDATLWCWGGQDHGTLGNGVRASVPPWRLTPSRVLGLTDVAALPSWGSTVGPTFAARLRDGALRAWGIGDRGEVGDGSGQSRAVPAVVARIRDAARVVAGIQHLCSIRADMSVSCWGAGTSGELGDGNTSDATSPVSAVGVAEVTDLALGPDVSIALRRDGAVLLWGHSRGLVANARAHATPLTLPPLANATQLAVVMPHDWRQVCALRRGGRVSCLGAQLPRVGEWFDMGLENVTQIAGSPAAVGCARHADGTVSCWGNNRNGCLGDPALPQADQYMEPQRVRTRDGALLSGVRSVRPGIGKVCAVRDDGTLWCWGACDNGVLGRGLTQWSATPRRALGMD